MENRANFALIGMFVLVAFAAAVGFFIWLSGTSLNKEYDFYEVSFDGGVRGLNEGSEVRFNGLSIGQVTRLRYDEEDPNLVLARIQVSENTPIDTAASAQLFPLGLTGLNYIEITPGPALDPVMLNSLPGRTKRIVGQASAVDDILLGGGDVLTEAQIALRRANLLLSDDNLQTFSQILKNIEQVTASVDLSELEASKLNDLMDSLTQAADAIAETARSIEGTSETIESIAGDDLRALLASADSTLGNVDGTLSSFDGVAAGVGDDASALIVDARDAINRLSNSGLTDIEETLDAVRSLVDTLGRVADSLEQSPTEFIVGTEREEVVLPQ